VKRRGPLPAVLAGSRRGLMAWLLVNGIAQAATMAGIAIATRHGFDGLHQPEVAPNSVLAHAAAIAVLGLALMWLRMAERTTAERLGQSYLTATRLRLFDHLNNLPSRVLQKRTQGVLMVRFVADLNALNDWVSRGLARLAVAAITIVSAVGVLAWLDPLIATCVAGAIAVAVATLAAAGSPLYLRVRELRRARGRMAANLGEKLNVYSPVRVFGRTRGERSRLQKQSSRLAQAAVSQARLAALLRAVPDAASTILTALVLAAGLLRVQQAGWGTLLAAILVVNLLDSPLRDLGRIFVFWQNFRAGRDVLGGFLRLPTLASGRRLPPLSPGPGHLALDQVSVAGALTQVSAEAPPGSLIAITGGSGAGKSTILGLAARMFDPDQGTVRLDGQALAAHDLTSIRQAVGMISPDLPLLRGSIRRNLTYRASDANDAEIADALQLCGLQQAIAALPRGLDTRIAERGADLPAALRQRLIVARAVMGGPRLLLIDDADALLDEVRTGTLARVLRRRGTTILLVTSDPQWLSAADAVWRLDAGQLQSVKETKHLHTSEHACAEVNI